MEQVLAVKDHQVMLLQEVEAVQIRVGWSTQREEDHKMLLRDRLLHRNFPQEVSAEQRKLGIHHRWRELEDQVKDL